jgi:hypothetical protein
LSVVAAQRCNDDVIVFGRKPLSNRDRIVGAAIIDAHELEAIPRAQRFGDSSKTTQQFRESLGLVEYR